MPKIEESGLKGDFPKNSGKIDWNSLGLNFKNIDILKRERGVYFF